MERSTLGLSSGAGVGSGFFSSRMKDVRREVAGGTSSSFFPTTLAVPVKSEVLRTAFSGKPVAMTVTFT